LTNQKIGNPPRIELKKRAGPKSFFKVFFFFCTGKPFTANA
jgi:hypothetical protein